MRTGSLSTPTTRTRAMERRCLWGAVAASSLVIGALLGLARQWPDPLGRPRPRLRGGCARQRGLRSSSPRRGSRSAAAPRWAHGLGGRGAHVLGARPGRAPTAAAAAPTRDGAGTGRVPRRQPRAARAGDRARDRGRGEHRAAGRDLRLQPAGGDRLGEPDARGDTGRRPSVILVAAWPWSRPTRPRWPDGRPLRDRRLGLRTICSRRGHRRLRRGCPAGDAGRLDDPGGHAQGRQHRGLVTTLGFAVAAGLSSLS